jgi:Zn-dependent M28 family amino/carboxypeptidase
MWLLIVGLALLGALGGVWALLTQPVISPGPSLPAPPVSPDNLRAHVETLCGPLAPRDSEHPENLDRVAEYVRREFERAGGEVSEQAYQVGAKTYRNVIASFGPAAKEGEEIVVVGAHYDAFGEFPGADDNASGVAGLIELAHLMGAGPPATRVELAAYTLEEPPYFRSEQMGSAVHAASLKARRVGVRAALVLEMIGYFSDAPASQGVPHRALSWLYPSRGDFIAVVGDFGQIALTRRVKAAMRRTGLIPVRSINAPGSLPGIDFSDHLNYWRAGYRAVMITDTAFYRNPNYHTPRDKPGTLDYNRLAATVRAVHAAVIALAEAD